MAAELAATLALIGYCRKKAENVLSNKKTCADLADNLAIVEDILTSCKSANLANTENRTLQRVLKKLHVITDRANFLFNKCVSGKLSVRIRNVLSSTSIKEELQKLHTELLLVIGMLLLVFQIEPTAALSRSDIQLPRIDKSVFDALDNQDVKTAEEYYEDDEN